jgi:hypothetical protein
VNLILKLKTSCHSSLSVRLHIAYASLQYSAYAPIVSSVPKPEMTKNCRLRNKIFMVMIFTAGEPPQYIVVPPTGGKTWDMVRISQ